MLVRHKPRISRKSANTFLAVIPLFDVDKHSAKHLRQFKYTCLTLIPSLLDSEDFVSKVSAKVLVACENIRFSSLFVAEDVSRGGTSATQRQKFHTDDANQCLHNKSGSYGVPNINLSNFASLLVDFGKVLC